MYKYLLFRVFVMLTLVGVFSSCSQDDSDVENLADNHAQPIEFTLDVTSRGAETTLKNLESIYVYGYYTDADGEVQQCFDDATYENGIVEFKKSSDGYYKPETPIYWGKSWGETVTFLAFNPLTAEKGHLNDKDNTVYETIKIEKVSKQDIRVKISPSRYAKDSFDFITAKAETTKNDSRNGVPLTFTHPLSQVELKFKTSENSDYSVDVYGAGIALVRGCASGSYNFTSNNFTDKSDSGTSLMWLNTEGKNIDTTPQSINENNGNIFFLPDSYSAYTFNKSGIFNWMQDVKYMYISLYTKVYDSEHKKILYPTATDLTNTFRTASAMKNIFNYYEPDLPVTELGCSYLPICTNIDFKPGYKYVITVDLTDGIGYLNPADKEKPGESVLNPSLSAKVQVTEYKIGDDIPEVSE